MWLRQCDTHAEASSLEAAAQRPARDETAAVGRHIGASLVVIAYAYIEVGARYEVGAKDKVAK